ncbi:unnamed protein product [Clonostachys rosea f. rosea IK726]|uniref:AAA+ ATPase domain-containing protein n=2 Tax=Bionectria ochroleuca TaxID=29856 RepID=A0A0B7KL40_BIOOC|nr:unnamed protein product [Clonostachys rosea f. rosea IK726]
MNLLFAMPIVTMMGAAEMIPRPLMIFVLIYGCFQPQIDGFVIHYFTRSLEASIDDPTFRYLEDVLCTKVKNPRHLIAKETFATMCENLDATLKKGTANKSGYTVYPRHQNKWEIRFKPSYGLHHFWENGRLHIIESKKGKYNQDAKETIRLYTFRTPGSIMDIFGEAVTGFNERSNRVTIWIPGPDKVAWRQASLRPPRHGDTLSLPHIKDEVLQRTNQHFLPSTELWYLERGLPWKLGFCFHGPPGTGKSSLVHVLASQFEVDIYSMVFTPDMTDISLLVLCSNIPKRCILLIEDIEKSQIKQNIRGEDAKDSRSDKGVSLSGLLNLLDGLCARDGRILIMNLNDRSEIDASLVRPGRIDETYEFKNASPFQAAEMFQNTYQKTLLEDEIAKLSQEFSHYIPDEQFSPATVQSYLLEYKGKPKEAVKNAGKKFRLKINDQGNFGLDTDQGDAWDQEFACFDKLITERALRNDAQPNDKRSQLSDKLAIWNANHKWHEVISAPETYSTLEDLEIIRKYRDEIFSMFAKDLVILVELGTGASEKIKAFIEKCVQENRPCYYLAVDISQGSLDTQQAELLPFFKDHPLVRLHFLREDFETASREYLNRLPGKRVFCSFADVIINNENPTRLLKVFRQVLRPGDLIYVSQDTELEDLTKRRKYYDQKQCWDFIDDWVVKDKKIDITRCRRDHIFKGRMHAYRYTIDGENIEGSNVEVFESFHYSKEEVQKIFYQEGIELVKVFGKHGLSMNHFIMKPGE